jgi:hypothetical protein
MADNIDNQENDKTPLLKPKKPRPPMSEKQMENFKKMAFIRSENIKNRKAEKFMQAKRELLEKEGYIKRDSNNVKLEPNQLKETTLAKKNEVEQFNISDTDEQEISKKPTKQDKSVKQKTVPLNKPEKIKKETIKKKQVIELSSSSESEESDSNNSSSSEEIVIIKRTKKSNKLKKQKQPKQRIIEEEPEEEEYIAPPINYSNYFL